MHFEHEITQSLRYLQSDLAVRALAADAYWPKWHSPWWHMLLLHEMGHASLIPKSIVDQYVTALDRLPVKKFPIHPEDLPPGADPYRGAPCHCQLGNVYQVLSSCGVDVDDALPWIRPWFLRYQMSDGGLNCDEGAYLVKDECPSSMVGTIAAFEAVLLHTRRPWTPEETAFLDAASRFLITRELRLGSPTAYNASERTAAASWLKLCFPRFYFYDVLRGLNAILLWAEKTRGVVPFAAIRAVVDHLSDGPVLIGRRSYEGVTTLAQSSSGEWLRRQEAKSFPLLDAVSVVGSESPYLSGQWAAAKRRLVELSIVGS